MKQYKWNIRDVIGLAEIHGRMKEAIGNSEEFYHQSKVLYDALALQSKSHAVLEEAAAREDDKATADHHSHMRRLLSDSLEELKALMTNHREISAPAQEAFKQDARLLADLASDGAGHIETKSGGRFFVIFSEHPKTVREKAEAEMAARQKGQKEILGIIGKPNRLSAKQKKARARGGAHNTALRPEENKRLRAWFKEVLPLNGGKPYTAAAAIHKAMEDDARGPWSCVPRRKTIFNICTGKTCRKNRQRREGRQ